MRIIKSTESIPVDHPVFLIFGQPGIGKSSLGYSAKDPLTLDFDRGAHRAANRKDTLVIDSWKDVTDLMQDAAALEPYRTITVDTVGRCLDVMTADIIHETPKLGPNGNLSQQGWGVLKGRFRTWMSSLRTLGKDVLLLAHDKEDKDGDTRIVRADIVGGSYGEVMKIADFVGYLQMNGRHRVLDFNPTDRWTAKNPAGWDPFTLPPVAKAQTFMVGLFDQGRKALGDISEESAAIMRTVDDWRAKIVGFTNAKDCNDVIPAIKALPVIAQAQISKDLMAFAKARGLHFNATTKHFADPTPEPATATT